jgi:hypothetical protein
MAYESFDNISQLELQAAIEVEINLFENSRSGHTYIPIWRVPWDPEIFEAYLVEMCTFQPNMPQQFQ